MGGPLFQLGKTVVIKNEIPGRLCLGKGYKKIMVPPGKYKIFEHDQNEDFAGDAELSDGYTYRIVTGDHNNSYRDQRISVWQNDLQNGVSKVED